MHLMERWVLNKSLPLGMDISHSLPVPTVLISPVISRSGGGQPLSRQLFGLLLSLPLDDFYAVLAVARTA
jgi:hypothetical protein